MSLESPLLLAVAVAIDARGRQVSVIKVKVFRTPHSISNVKRQQQHTRALQSVCRNLNRKFDSVLVLFGLLRSLKPCITCKKSKLEVMKSVLGSDWLRPSYLLTSPEAVY